MKYRSAQGFTLIELIVTITMMGIVLATSVPKFKSSISNSILTTGINELITSLNYARSEAIRQGMTVTVRKTSSSVGWEGGWQVFTDANANGSLDASTDQVLRVLAPLKSGYTLQGNNNFTNYISYQSNGVSNTIGSFALCDATQTLTTMDARVISINILGRITLATGNSNGLLQDSSGQPFNNCSSP